jgi:NADH dehydrogenase FAD-containing subunit
MTTDREFDASEHFPLDAKTGRVKVDKFLRVHGLPTVFCAGDLCNTDETKLGYVAALQGEVVAENILQLVLGYKKGQQPMGSIPLRAYDKQSSTIMFVTLGPDNGASQLPGGFVVG